jgi:hypothetical protein
LIVPGNAFVEVEGEGHPAADRTYVYDRCDLGVARRDAIALADWYGLPVDDRAEVRVDA